MEAIRNEIPEVQYVAGALRGNTQIVFAENNASTSWQGVQSDFFDINSWVIANGEGFDAQDYSSAAKVVILGETVRRTLFGEDSGIGQTVRLGRVPFTVVGTLAPKGQGGFGQDQDDVMMVPLETARRRLMGSMGLPPGAVMQVALTVADAKDLSYVQGEVEALLRQRHKIKAGDDDDFTVLHHVLLILEEQVVRAQGRVQVVDQQDVCGIVETTPFGQQSHAGEDLFGVLVPGLAHQYLMTLFVHPVIARPVFFLATG